MGGGGGWEGGGNHFTETEEDGMSETTTHSRGWRHTLKRLS